MELSVLFVTISWIFCIITQSRGDKSSSSTCGGGDSVREEDLCYYHHSPPLSWSAARSSCLAQGGLLVIFRNLATDKDVISSLNALGVKESTTWRWLGLARDASGSYFWSDGSSVTGAWHTKVSETTSQGQGCVALDSTAIARSNEVSLQLRNCSEALSYVCVVDRVNAVWSGWTAWSDCSATCGAGTKSRQRTCLAAVSGDNSCSGLVKDEQQCSAPACLTTTTVSQDSSWESWGPWSDCSVPCGGGERSRTRRCLATRSGQVVKYSGQQAGGNTGCSGQDQQSDMCSPQPCGDASWEGWGQWSACSATASCSKGLRTRSRLCTYHAAIATMTCKGADSDTMVCVTSCRGLSKVEMVDRLRPGLSPQEAARLDKWARDTQRVTESMVRPASFLDHALQGYVISNVTVDDRMLCVIRCLALKDDCRSFNFQFGVSSADHVASQGKQHVCELNSASSDEAASSVVTRVGFMLYDLNAYIPFAD